jgi:N-acyl-L-homoserine lactone synthetase
VKDVLFLTTPALIEQHWPDVAQLVAPVVDQAARGEFTLADLQELVVGGHAFAGLMFEANEPRLAMVFEFRHYPRRTTLNVMALGGSELASAAVSFWPQFVAWAKESGADAIEALTAPAMTRVLRNLGFQHTYDLVRFTC